MKVFLRTFGCRANHYDSEMVRAMVQAAGGEIVATAAEADVAVFNSCAVTAEAEADLRQAVRRAARERPALRSVVMGCAAARPRDRHEPGAPRSLPTVSHVVPGADAPALAVALDLPPRAAAVATSTQSGTRALLRVQDGCDEHCTFCVTTLARGANRSRPIEALVDEATRLSERHPEIVLTGVHVGTYGCDIATSLGALVERLVADVPNARFRLASVEATEVDERLTALLRAGDGRVCPFLHAPLQSGSDRLLRRMGRHWYTAASYAEAVWRLVDGRPAFGLGADVIAGFPGETEDDHTATMRLVETLPITALHVFPFSVRPGTPAARLGDHLDGPTIARRARELRALGGRKAGAYAAARAGGNADVIVIGEAGVRRGFTEDGLTVDLAEPATPRGTRLDALLRVSSGGLTAVRRAPTRAPPPPGDGAADHLARSGRGV